MIRTINERLRRNGNIVVERKRSGLSKILFALRSEKNVDGKQCSRNIWPENLIL